MILTINDSDGYERFAEFSADNGRSPKVPDSVIFDMDFNDTWEGPEVVITASAMYGNDEREWRNFPFREFFGFMEMSEE